MEKKLKQFEKDIEEFTPIVFCVNCGSTKVDQNFATQLRCFNCGNTLDTWDYHKFGIVRAHGAKGPIYKLSDVKNLFVRISEESKKSKG